jgi:hypothetical protein
MRGLKSPSPVLGGLGGGIGIASAMTTREEKPVLGGLGDGMGMPSAKLRATMPNRYS